MSHASVPHGGMVYWRFKGDKEWRFGYATIEKGSLYRMGLWNGCTSQGPIVDSWDIETKPH